MVSKRTKRLFKRLRGVTFLMDTLSYAMSIFGGYYETNRGWRHYRVEGKTYDIKFHPMTLEWSCSCPAYKFGRGKHCKHIKKIQEGKK